MNPLLLLAGLWLSISGQEPQGPRLTDAADPQQEMTELFKQVELQLRQIDRLLYDASSGDTPLEQVGDGGIAKLLENARSRAGEVHKGIDRILELARAQQSQKQQSSGQGQGQPKDPGEQGSPLDRPGGRQERDQGEQGQAPEKPDPNQNREGQGDSEPHSPRDSNQDPSQREGGTPPQGPTGSGSTSESRDRWGDLPEQVRDVFRTEGGGDLPPQYRDWIDAYYRRLNRRP